MTNTSRTMYVYRYEPTSWISIQSSKFDDNSGDTLLTTVTNIPEEPICEDGFEAFFAISPALEALKAVIAFGRNNYPETISYSDLVK